MIFRYRCCSRNGVWRFEHSFDRDGVCIFCDRTRTEADLFYRVAENNGARMYWNPLETGIQRRRMRKYRHYEISE